MLIPYDVLAALGRWCEVVLPLCLLIHLALHHNYWAERFRVLKSRQNFAQKFCDPQAILWPGKMWGCKLEKMLGLPLPEPFPHTLVCVHQQGEDATLVAFATLTCRTDMKL